MPLRATLLDQPQMLMPRLGAEMGQVDPRHGIVADDFEDFALRHPGEDLARLEHRQRADEPAGIVVPGAGRMRCHGQGICLVLELVAAGIVDPPNMKTQEEGNVMTRMMNTTALALGLTMAAGGALAEAHTEMGMGSGRLTADNLSNTIRAESLIGSNVYTLEAEYDETVWVDTPYYEEVDAEWEEIGEVEDIVISADGQMIGLVIETGGWLDIGDEEVVLDFNEVRLAGDYVGGDFSLVTRMSQEQLEALPEANEGYYNWWN